MNLAVYTTIYPGVEAYLPDWSRSLREQTDKDFQLWIGLDQLEVNAVKSLIGPDLAVNWVVPASATTAAQIRQDALAKVVQASSGVVLVDSDDVLHPSRVAAAREALKDNELVGCALRLVDQQGRSLGVVFDLPRGLDPMSVFPRNNVFGFSNSAFRCDILKRCLPISPNAILVDWFLATIAWLLDARMTFDRVPRMDYRQHPYNTARVMLPFSREQVILDASLVRQHFELVLAEHRPGFSSSRFDELGKVSKDVERFHRLIVCDSARLDTYIRILNDMNPPPLWWTCVAHPHLRDLWN